MISSGFIVGGLCLCGEQDTMLRAPLISLQTSFSRFKRFLKHFSSAKEHKGVVVIKTSKQKIVFVGYQKSDQSMLAKNSSFGFLMAILVLKGGKKMPAIIPHSGNQQKAQWSRQGQNHSADPHPSLLPMLI